MLPNVGSMLPQVHLTPPTWANVAQCLPNVIQRKANVERLHAPSLYSYAATTEVVFVCFVLRHPFSLAEAKGSC